MAGITVGGAFGRVLLGAALLVPPLAGAARAQECQGAPAEAKISIVIENVSEARGLMTASLYPNDKKAFLVKDGAVKVWRVAAAAPVTRMCIWRAAGTYALAVYQDVNSNHRFDVGMFGPAEPYGFSNNPRIFFSKPSLAAVRFVAKAGETVVHVRLNQP